MSRESSSIRAGRRMEQNHMRTSPGRHEPSDFPSAKKYRIVISFRSVPQSRAFGNARLYATGPRADLTEDRCRFRHWALRVNAAKRRSLNLYRQFALGRLPMRFLRKV